MVDWDTTLALWTVMEVALLLESSPISGLLQEMMTGGIVWMNVCIS